MSLLAMPALAQHCKGSPMAVQPRVPTAFGELAIFHGEIVDVKSSGDQIRLAHSPCLD